MNGRERNIVTLHTMAALMLEPKFVDELLSPRHTGREAPGRQGRRKAKCWQGSRGGQGRVMWLV